MGYPSWPVMPTVSAIMPSYSNTRLLFHMILTPFLFPFSCTCCLWWHLFYQPIRHIHDLHTLVLICFLPGAGKDHLRIGVLDLQQGIDLTPESVGIVDTAGNLDIYSQRFLCPAWRI